VAGRNGLQTGHWSEETAERRAGKGSEAEEECLYSLWGGSRIKGQGGKSEGRGPRPARGFSKKNGSERKKAEQKERMWIRRSL